MRIFSSITYYHPYVSGLTLYAKRAAEAFSRHGHESSVLCMRHDPSLAVEETVGGVRILRAKPLLRVSKGFLSVDFIVRAVREMSRTDAVFIHLPQPEGWVVALAAKLAGKRVTSVYHCEVDLAGGFVSRIIRWGLETANMCALHLSDAIIAYTDEYRMSSRLLRPYRAKTNVILPPVPCFRVDPARQAAYRKRIGKKGFVIGVAARLAREKGFEHLFDAIPIIEDLVGKPVTVAVAGPLDPVGEETYRKRIMRKVHALGDKVVFLGSVPQDSMGAFYSTLDVLALPSINSTEAFGLVQAEAMLLGIPVVASDLPGVRVPVGLTGMGLVVPKADAAALARGIAAVIASKSTYQAGKTQAASLFSEQASYEAIMETVCGKK